MKFSDFLSTLPGALVFNVFCSLLATVIAGWWGSSQNKPESRLPVSNDTHHMPQLETRVPPFDYIKFYLASYAVFNVLPVGSILLKSISDDLQSRDLSRIISDNIHLSGILARFAGKSVISTEELIITALVYLAPVYFVFQLFIATPLSRLIADVYVRGSWKSDWEGFRLRAVVFLSFCAGAGLGLLAWTQMT